MGTREGTLVSTGRVHWEGMPPEKLMRNPLACTSARQLRFFKAGTLGCTAMALVLIAVRSPTLSELDYAILGVVGTFVFVPGYIFLLAIFAGADTYTMLIDALPDSMITAGVATLLSSAATGEVTPLGILIAVLIASATGPLVLFAQHLAYKGHPEFHRCRDGTELWLAKGMDYCYHCGRPVEGR